LGALASKVAVLNAAFDRLIVAHTRPQDSGEVRALLADRRYVDAAKRAARPAAREGAVLGDDQPLLAGRDIRPSVSAGPSGVDLPNVPQVEVAAGYGITATEPVHVHRARIWRQLILDQAVLTLMVGAAIAIVGYYMYSTTFVGTGRELLTIFMWAFGLDVGVQTLVAQSARVASPGGAA
jgi:hypothetical protein